MLYEILHEIQSVGGVGQNVVDDGDGDGFKIGFRSERIRVKCGGTEVEEGGFLADLVDYVAVVAVDGGVLG